MAQKYPASLKESSLLFIAKTVYAIVEQAIYPLLAIALLSFRANLSVSAVDAIVAIALHSIIPHPFVPNSIISHANDSFCTFSL